LERIPEVTFYRLSITGNPAQKPAPICLNLICWAGKCQHLAFAGFFKLPVGDLLNLQYNELFQFNPSESRQVEKNMKRSALRFSVSLLAGLLLLSACGKREIKLHGHMSSIQYQGNTCWIFIDDNHNSYEVVTPSPQILREGLRMQIRAVEVDRKTLCDLPTVIEIEKFRPDTINDL